MISFSKKKKKNDLGEHLSEKHLQDFFKSLEELLVDITALEVNTMIVEEITTDKFIPWSVYRDIYPICLKYLQNLAIHPSLYHRYFDLRKRLELEYALLLTDPNSDFYESALIGKVTEDLPILTNPHLDWSDFHTKLPPPEEVLIVRKLLENNRFLRILRQLAELKKLLDNRNILLTQQKIVTTDLIYAQTVVQLDGKITNRYTQEIFNHPQKDEILRIHQYGLELGEKQWRVLLKIIVDLLRRFRH